MSAQSTQKILRIDLTRNRISKENVNPQLVKLLLGGPGIAAKILYDEVEPWIDAFDPLNRLIFCPGLLTGTLVPSVGRHFVITKSPLTGLLWRLTQEDFGGLS